MRFVELSVPSLFSQAFAAILVLAVTACATPQPIIYYPPEGAPLPDIAREMPPEGAPLPDIVREMPPIGTFQPNADLYVCKGLRASNAPPSDTSRRIMDFSPVIVVDGVVMASVPVNDVCLTSGYGQRNGRMHKGIDLQSRPAGIIYTAAPGTILEARVSNGYGNMVVIAHGGGVFTRYAHFASFADGVVAGRRIGFGQPLGIMGASGNATAIHLHFEILTGNYNNPKRSFGLTTRDPFSFPAYVPAPVGS